MSKRIYAQYKFLFFSQIVLVAITIIFVLTLIVPLIEPFLVPGALGEVGLRGLLNFAMDNLDWIIPLGLILMSVSITLIVLTRSFRSKHKKNN
jgi:tellurite resistance protein TehA-like permease